MATALGDGALRCIGGRAIPRRGSQQAASQQASLSVSIGAWRRGEPVGAAPGTKMPAGVPSLSCSPCVYSAFCVRRDSETSADPLTRTNARDREVVPLHSLGVENAGRSARERTLAGAISPFLLVGFSHPISRLPVPLFLLFLLVSLIGNLPSMWFVFPHQSPRQVRR